MSFNDNTEHRHLTTAAAPAESGREPISGLKGRGTANEPYDMGNKMENPNLSGASGSEARGGIAGGFSTAGSSVGTAPESGIQIGQKHQGADRPTEDPTSTSGRHDIGSASAGTDAMAREVDGGHVPGLHYRESNASHSSSSASASQDVHGQRTRSLIPPMDGEDEEAMKKRIAKAERRRESDADSKSKAAAVPVKSTGLAADGGDFDATKPGAGKEADRLMDQKGIRRSEDEHDHDQGHAHRDGEGKVPLGTRIKEKIFTGSHGT